MLKAEIKLLKGRVELQNCEMICQQSHELWYSRDVTVNECLLNCNVLQLKTEIHWSKTRC